MVLINSLKFKSVKNKGDVMRLFVNIILALFMMSSMCFAMNMESMVKVGSVSFNPSPINGGIEISGAHTFIEGDKNKGVVQIQVVKDSNEFTINKNQKSVEAFDKLYFHFDSKNEISRFGSDNFNNAVPLYIFEGNTSIYKIFNDTGLYLYLFASETGGGGSISVIGTTKDGKWVKYFNTRDAKESFNISSSAYCDECYVYGDTVILGYFENGNKICELRFKWNEAAQWFGVEKIVN